MNEIKISNSNLPGIFVGLVVISLICAGIIYYYRGADRQLEHELVKLEVNNAELASATRQLQTEIATHSERITNISGRIADSQKRVQDVYSEIGQSAADVDRAGEIVVECEEILKAVKTQRRR